MKLKRLRSSHATCLLIFHIANFSSIFELFLYHLHIFITCFRKYPLSSEYIFLLCNVKTTMSYTYSIFVYSILYFNIFACCSFLPFFPLTYEDLSQKTVKGYLICLPLLIKILYCIVIIEFARATFSHPLFRSSKRPMPPLIR